MDATPTELLRRAEAIADGWTDAELRNRVRDGELTRVRRGGYSHGVEVDALPPEARHRLAVNLAGPQLTSGVVSHVSAAAMWDLPMVAADLRRVHVTLPKGHRTGRVAAERHDHCNTCDDDETAVVDGVRVTSAPRTLIDIARSAATSTAVAAADAALHRGLVTPTAVRAALDRAKGWPGIHRARRALALADGRAESPGESLTRLALRTVAPLDLQVDIGDETGRFVGRADLAVADAALLIEFDGRQKYLSHRRPGQSVEEAVLAEKQREDQLRALGYGVMRIVWNDLRTPEAVADLVRRAVVRGRVARERHGNPRGTFAPRPPVML